MSQFLLSLKSSHTPAATTEPITSTAHKIWVALIPRFKTRTKASASESGIASLVAYAMALTTIDPELQ